MASRLDLQADFEQIIGTRNVYFCPPESIKMKYDCIRYSGGGIATKYAGDKVYKKYNKYECIFITQDPDSVIPDVISEYFPMCSFGSPYTADNLIHFPFTLYY